MIWNIHKVPAFLGCSNIPAIFACRLRPQFLCIRVFKKLGFLDLFRGVTRPNLWVEPSLFGLEPKSRTELATGGTFGAKYEQFKKPPIQFSHGEQHTYASIL